MRIILAFAIAALCVTAARADSLSDNIAALKALTPEAVQSRIHLKDDSLDTVAIFDTQDAIRLRTGFFALEKNERFLRAFVTKRSGSAVFQVYEHDVYPGGSWRFFNAATYMTKDGAVDAGAISDINRNVITCSGGGDCLYQEDVGFEVPEQTLRWIASTYAPGAQKLWTFKFTSKSGVDLTDALSASEVAGLLATVDAYRQKLREPTASN